MIRILGKPNSFSGRAFRERTAQRYRAMRFIPSSEGLERRELLSLTYQESQIAVSASVDSKGVSYTNTIGQIPPNIAPISDSSSQSTTDPTTGATASLSVSLNSMISTAQSDTGSVAINAAFTTAKATYFMGADNTVQYEVIGTADATGTLVATFSSNSSSSQNSSVYPSFSVGGPAQSNPGTYMYSVFKGQQYVFFVDLNESTNLFTDNQSSATATGSSNLSWNLVPTISQNPDLSMVSAAITPDGKNVNAAYSITGANLPTPGTIDFYWATGPNLSNKLGNAVSVPTQTAVGSYTASTSLASLGARPSGATYILAVADSSDADPVNYFTSAQIPVLRITKEPAQVIALNTNFDVQVEADINGSKDTNFTGLISLYGQSVNAVSGVADFPGLNVSTTGTFSLTASSTGFVSATTTPFTVAYTPTQIRTAYGINAIPNFSISQAPNGSGQTIAILSPYDNPQISNDLNTFDTTFGLPAPPVFAVLNAQGLPTPLPGSDPTRQYSLEEALDVEWAHAVAPGANIVVFEFDPAKIDYSQVAQTAATFNNVSSISMSFDNTFPENANELNLDHQFTTPSNHQGVTFVASTGDDGGSSNYPAYSPNVLAVGGTTLNNVNANGKYPGTTMAGEIGWSGSSGGESVYEKEPSYQSNNGITTLGDKRSVPDVSFDADSATGVLLYDVNASMQFGGNAWDIGNGTSLGAPSWAGLLAIANQGRVVTGHGTLDGPSQTLPALYYFGTNTSDFNDIVLGKNVSYNAGSGYDLVTGLGTPKAQLLIPALMSWQQDVSSQLTATKSGLVFNRATQLYGGTLTLTNTGTTTFIGSFEVVLNNLPAGVSVANPSGYTANGSPYILVNFSGSLTHGQGITFSVAFKNPKNVSILYTPDIIY